MANEQNLIPQAHIITVEEASKGGKRSAEVRKEKKLLRELLEEALSTNTETGNRYIDITNAIINEATAGNVKAYEIIRDTLGQKPKDIVENTIINNPVNDLIKSIEAAKNESK